MLVSFLERIQINCDCRCNSRSPIDDLSRLIVSPVETLFVPDVYSLASL